MRKMQVNSLAELVSRLGFRGKCAIRPVFAGDTLYAESTVLSKRESKGRPTQGIVTVLTRGINQDDVEAMSFERTMLMIKADTHN
jgi:itaconyl-CoA hydratase